MKVAKLFNFSMVFLSCMGRRVHGLRTYALPTEIMQYVFLEYARLEEAGWEDDPERSIYLWTRILGVCRWWKDIALSYPHLWTGILMRESRRISFNTLARKFLGLSRGQPIRLYVVASRSPPLKHEIDPRIRELLQQAIPRAREIHIRSLRLINLESFWSMFNAPAKSMSSLWIILKPPGAPPNPSASQRPPLPPLQRTSRNLFVIPCSGLFGDTTPKLRSISIYGASLPPVKSMTPKLLLQRLQSVDITEDSLYSDNLFPTPLYHLRITAPTLTVLKLHSNNRIPRADVPDNLHRIAFPRL